MDLNKLSENDEHPTMEKEITDIHSQVITLSIITSNIQNKNTNLEEVSPKTKEGTNVSGMRCHLCGSSAVHARCSQCNDAWFCNECFRIYHAHPRRNNHMSKVLEKNKTLVLENISKRQCLYCTYINSEECEICEMCSKTNKFSRMKTNSNPCTLSPRSTLKKELSITSLNVVPRSVCRMFSFDKRGEGQWKCDRCSYINSAKARTCNICLSRTNKYSSLPSNLYSVTDRSEYTNSTENKKRIRMIQGEYDITNREEAIQVMQLIDKGYLPIVAIKEIKQMSEFTIPENMKKKCDSIHGNPLSNSLQSSQWKTTACTSKTQNCFENHANLAPNSLSAANDDALLAQRLVGKTEKEQSEGELQEASVFENTYLLESADFNQNLPKPSAQLVNSMPQSSGIIVAEFHREQNDLNVESLGRTNSPAVEQPKRHTEHETQQRNVPPIKVLEAKESLVEHNSFQECLPLSGDSCNDTFKCATSLAIEYVIAEAEVIEEKNTGYEDVQLRYNKVTINGISNTHPWTCNTCKAVNKLDVCKICAHSKQSAVTPTEESSMISNTRKINKQRILIDQKHLGDGQQYGDIRRASFDFKGLKLKSRKSPKKCRSRASSMCQFGNEMEKSAYASSVDYNNHKPSKEMYKSRPQRLCIIL